MSKECKFLLPDDYPCRDKGTQKVGRNWYCAEHASAIKYGDLSNYNEEEEV